MCKKSKTQFISSQKQFFVGGRNGKKKSIHKLKFLTKEMAAVNWLKSISRPVEPSGTLLFWGRGGTPANIVMVSKASTVVVCERCNERGLWNLPPHRGQVFQKLNPLRRSSTQPHAPRRRCPLVLTSKSLGKAIQPQQYNGTSKQSRTSTNLLA